MDQDPRPEVGEEWRLYLTLHCHHQNDPCSKMSSGDICFNNYFIVRDDFCIKMGSDESSFDFPLIVTDD